MRHLLQPLVRPRSQPLCRALACLVAIAAFVSPALAGEDFRLEYRELAAGVHALVGPIGARTYDLKPISAAGKDAAPTTAAREKEAG